MPRLKDFESKREIDREIRLVTTEIEDVTKEIKDKRWEATKEQAKQLCASCIVTSGPTEYTDEERAMAQQQCNEHEERGLCALHRKENRERRLETLNERIKDLQEFRDNWTGAD
ncbi:hypothetical protein FANTH_9643 [Fusarium anthophilum]|uniref:Uncharacterized protein n=1 Tax=Fusarium anthophilum TaxID=48485 RepID=A0A8H4Z5Y8_9HYPO|nr:hypothetical protein FANTH_9643 [Fusarium anthophilum]